MADIFISYKSEDRALAQPIAQGLEAEGFSVWWDRQLTTGDDYQETIDVNLRKAFVVVVLWSAASVKSRWVRSEATIGDRYGALSPVMVQNCDRPVAFELVQCADLIGWGGDHEAPPWKAFINDVRTKVAARRGASSHQAATPGAGEIEAVFWQSIKQSSDPADYRAYLARYPKGRFTGTARSRSKAKKQSVAPLIAAIAGVAVAAIVGWYALNGSSAVTEVSSPAIATSSPQTPVNQVITRPVAASADESSIQDPLVRRAAASGLLGKWCGDANARGGDITFSLVDGQLYANEVLMTLRSVEGRAIVTTPYTYTMFDDHMRYDIFGDYHKC